VNQDLRPVGGIEVGEDPTRGEVRLWGDVDASLREQASVAMIELLRRGGPYVVDMSGVTFIDSSGIAFVLQLHRLATDEGSTVILRDPPHLVTDMLELIGLAGTIPQEFTGGGAVGLSATPA